MPTRPTNPHAYPWRADELAGVPLLLAGLTDDDAIISPGNVGLVEALAAHRAHRAAAYAPIVGALLVPAADLAGLGELVKAGELAEAGSVDIGLVGSCVDIEAALDDLVSGIAVVQIEAPAAARGEDPVSGVRTLLDTIEEYVVDGVVVYAEIPLTDGLLATLDVLAEARDEQWEVAAKFRTGGPTTELLPSPVDLAGVICACRDRDLPFKLTAGLHRAVRHTDPGTGQPHHGFLNVLVATMLGSDGARPDELVEWLECTDAPRLAEAVRGRLDQHRPLLYSFGACSIAEPLVDLRTLGLLAAAG